MKKIGFDLLKSSIFGSINTFEENGAIKLRRFTDKQMKHFDATLNYIDKPRKCRASSGMNIDFYTDSTTVKFKLNCYVASSQSLCYIDIYTDGVMNGHFGYDAKENGRVSTEFEVGNGKKRVTIWLPCLFEISIANFEIDDNAYFEPAKKDCSIMFLGDSITQGYTTEFPSLTYTNIVTSRMNAHGINQGIGGALFDESDLDAELLFQPDIIFVAYGTNDWYHSADRDLVTNADAFYKRLCSIYPKTKIYAILPIWRANIAKVSEIATMSFEEMHIILENICNKYSVGIINGLELTPHCAEFFRSDGTHPNEIGFLQYGENLYNIIRNTYHENILDGNLIKKEGKV